MRSFDLGQAGLGWGEWVYGYGAIAIYMNSKFSKFARRSALIMGNPRTFAIALGLIAVWGVSGFFVGFGDSWQLVANTTTTILTTLMVLLVQHTQNRDAQAMQIKLNEIIRGLSSTRNKVIALEDREPDEAEVLRQEFKKIRDEEN